MDIPFIINGIRERLPGNVRFRILKDCIQLYRQEPHIAFYKRQIRLNIRAYFRIKPYYGAMLYEKADVPARLYHVTERVNLPSILQNGLYNDKSGVVFLTDQVTRARSLAVRKALSDPVVLQIDTDRLRQSGSLVFVNTAKPYFFVTERIPAAYLTVI